MSNKNECICFDVGTYKKLDLKLMKLNKCFALLKTLLKKYLKYINNII